LPQDDPALGLTGALTTLQNQPPLPAAAPAGSAPSSQDTGQAAEELSRAARSLESVQGSVSGQTQAIQQMTMAAQQQQSMINMSMNQLGNQISTLVQSINKLSTSMTMQQSYMPPPAPSMGPMAQPVGMDFGPPPAPAFPQARSMAAGAGGMAMAGARMGFSGLNRFGGAAGGVGAGAALPFFGTPVWAPGQGSVSPRIGGDVGAWGGAAMATGMGITPEMMRYGGANKMQELGSERFQQRFGDAALGLMGGAARLGTGLAADAAGFGLGGAIGGTLGSFALGGPIGAALAAPAAGAINEVMGQTSAMRGFGDQYARNAFRFMPQQGMGFGNLRRPGMQQRLQVGQQMNRMGIEDLAYDEKDIGEIFGGMSQQDLMRATRTQDEVVQRIRQGKETIKLIGRRMGQTIQESAGTMGEMQQLGFDPTSMRSRATIFGASSVQGLTPTEAMQRGLATGGQYTAQGLGREMAGMGLVGAQAAQVGIQTGRLSNIDIAAMGGREGAGGAIPSLVGSFLQSGVGKSMLMAGGAGATQGLNMQQVIGRGGAMANQDINRLIDIELGGEEQARELLQDPRALSEIVRMVSDQARVFKQGRPGVSDRNAMRLALRQYMPNASGAQLTAILKQVEGLPESQTKKAQSMATNLADEMSATTTERVAIVARAKRQLSRWATPTAEALAGGVTGTGVAMGNALTDVYRGVTGMDVQSTGAGMDIGTLTELRGRTSEDRYAYREQEMAMPDVGDVDPETRAAIARENRGIKARNAERARQGNVMSKKTRVNQRTKSTVDKQVRSVLADPANYKAIEEYKEQIKNGSPSDKKQAMKGLLDLMSSGTYGKYDASTPVGAQVMRAFNDKIQEELGVDAASILAGDMGPKAFGRAEKENLKEKREELRGLLDLESTETAALFEREEVADYLAAVGGAEGAMDIGEAEKRMLAALPEGEGARVLEIMRENEKQGFDLFGTTFSETASTAKGRARTAAALLKGGGGRFGEGAIGLGKKEGATLRTGVAGGAAAEVLMGLRKKKMGAGASGLIGRLAGGEVAGVTSAMGELEGKLTEADLAELEKGEIAGGKEFAAILREMKNIDGDNKLSGSERDALANMGMKAEKIDQISKGMNEGTVNRGDIMTMAMAGVDTAPMAMLMKGGPEGKQAVLMFQSMQQMSKITDQVMEISKIVKSIKEK
jgi:hypothetical protein